MRRICLDSSRMELPEKIWVKSSASEIRETALVPPELRTGGKNEVKMMEIFSDRS